MVRETESEKQGIDPLKIKLENNYEQGLPEKPKQKQIKPRKPGDSVMPDQSQSHREI